MADQEELVAMVFGDHPPEGWREDPDFRIYLDELGGLTPDRMVQVNLLLNSSSSYSYSSSSSSTSSSSSSSTSTASASSPTYSIF